MTVSVKSAVAVTFVGLLESVTLTSTGYLPAFTDLANVPDSSPADSVSDLTAASW